MVLFANGIFNYSTSLNLLHKTHSSVSFGLGLITGPFIGILLAKPITKLLHKYDNHKIATIRLIGATLSIFCYSLFINTPINLLPISIIFLSINSIFMRMFNYAYMNNQVYIVGEENIQKLNSLEQGGIAILQIINPIITASLWIWLKMSATL